MNQPPTTNNQQLTTNAGVSRQLTPALAGPEEESIQLLDYWRVILKRKWTIITVFAVVVLTTAIYTFTATPIFRASARLVIEKENPNVLSIEEVLAVDASGTDYYQTQYKIIESRSVAREVIRRLNLEESEEFFPPPKDDVLSNLKRTIRETIASWKQSILGLLKRGKAAEKAAGEGGLAPDSALVSSFLGRIKVSPIRNSRVVDISFEARDPVLATKVVNTLAQAYIDRNLETRLDAIKDAVRWLHNRIDEERRKVEKAELALLRYKEKHGIVTDFSSDAEQITAQKLAQLNNQVVEAESARVEAETRYRQALGLVGSPDLLDSIPEVLSSGVIQQIKAMEVELYKRMSELSKKYGRKHPRMVAIKGELNTLRRRKQQEINRVVNSLKSEYQVAMAREQSLKKALEKQKQEALELNQKAIEYGVLQREAESARQMYELLIKRFKETTLTEDMRTGNIRVLDRAEVPKFPVKPKKRLNLLLAIVVGLMLGGGLAFFFEYLDNTIKIPEDIKHHLGMPYLGPLPAFQSQTAENPGPKVSGDLVTLHSPKSTASEAFRGIRTGILFSSADAAPQVILVSSSGPREGKTLLTANLGVVMAQSGSSVIILDCDMRRPKMHRVFNTGREKGIANLLVGQAKANEVIVKTPVANLEVIPCGPIPPNPSEMLGSTRMQDLLRVLRKHYTHILIDSPPATAVTDAAVLSRWVDGVVLVVRAGDFAREIEKNGVNQFHSVGANILGAVLNGVDMGKDKYYYYQYYYYYYGEDGKKEKKKRTRKRAKSRYYYGQEEAGEPKAT